MNDRLDLLLGRLAAEPTDRRLDQFEAELGRDISVRRTQARIAQALAPVGVASVALALAMGMLAGGLAANTSATTSGGGETFMVAANLAPSSLLDDR